MSRREALQVALDCVRKAQSFFTEAVKHVKDPEVKRLFEELREEEVVHERLVASELSKLPPDPEVTADDYADEPVAQ
jgi:rubrerythrin